MSDVVIEAFKYSEPLLKRRKIELQHSGASIEKSLPFHGKSQQRTCFSEGQYLMNERHSLTDVLTNIKAISTSPTQTPTVTSSSNNSELMQQDNNASFQDCSCGFLHGPGQGHHHDTQAVGLSSFPLLRGPD